MHNMRGIVLSGVAVALLGACVGDDAASTDGPPRWDDVEVLAAGAARGPLHIDGSCVTVELDDTTTLSLILPDDAELTTDGDTATLRTGGHTFTDGDLVIANGSEVTDAESMVATGDASCLDHIAWLTAELTPPD